MLARRRNPGETLMHYYFKKMMQLEQLEIDGEKAVSFLIDGLDSQIMKHTAEAAGHKTPESLLAYFEKCTHEGSNIQPTKRLKINNRETTTTTMKRHNRCFLCRKSGHRAADCSSHRIFARGKDTQRGIVTANSVKNETRTKI